MFLGRSLELMELNKLYDKAGFHLAIVYGRRKVGKTSLLREFAKNKPSIFFVPEEHNEQLALSSFRKLIVNFFNINDALNDIKSWEDAFQLISTKSNGKKLVLVLDEFPYIASENPALPSIIQKIIDHNLKFTEIFLIISGSSTSFMENELLNSKSPLYGMRSAQFKLEPFDFYESRLFFPSRSFFEKIMIYSTLGGISQYLIQFDYNKDYEHNVMDNILKRSSYLYEEPESFLKSQIKDYSLASYMLSLLSKGSFNIEKLKKERIRDYIEFDITIKKLLDLNIISKKTSIGKSITKPYDFYKLEDNFFRYWFRFVFKNRNLIDMGMSNYLYQNKILTDINSHIGYVFEDICMQFLKKKNCNFELPFIFENIGSWIGYNPFKKKTAQIDIVAVNDECVLLGECKWHGEPIDKQTLDGLIDKGQLLKYPNKYYCLFSKNGFSQEVIKYSNDNSNILLFNLSELDI